MNKEHHWLLNEKYHGIETSAFHVDLKRLENGEPLAYVIGWVDFLGCPIALSARPLIPRPETEFWVEKAISTIRTNHHDSTGRTIHGSSEKGAGGEDRAIRVLDLFAGSGCIGIALLKHVPHAIVDFGEKDPKLCEQIQKNIALNDIDPGRTRVIETDVFSNVMGSYDYIFANPPYVDPARKDGVQKSVLSYEPHGALFADDGGLFFIKRLLEEAPAHLKQGGVMYIEFGEGQKETMVDMGRNTEMEIEFQRDQFDKWRIIQLSIS